MMKRESIITLLNREFPEEKDDRFKEAEPELILEEKINQLINNDFAGLVNFLYRVDVSEQKLKQLLRDSKGREAARTITNLIIERQIEKVRHRHSFKRDNPDDDEAERW